MYTVCDIKFYLLITCKNIRAQKGNRHFRFLTEETQEKNQVRGEDGGCGDLSAL